MQAGCTPPPATHCTLFPMNYCTAQLYVPQHPPYGQLFQTISSISCPSHSHLIPSQAAVPCTYFMINSTFMIQSAGGQQITDLRVDHTTTYYNLLPQDSFCQSSPPTPASSTWIGFPNKISSSYHCMHHLCQ